MDGEKVAKYDKVLSKCPEIERKGKSLPYTSVNGHMFSQLNKEGQLGIRFSGERKNELLEKLDTEPFFSYGKEMKGYIRIPEKLWEDMEVLAALLQESYEYARTLESN